MGTEAFYATAAQVLPAVLIALIIEIGLILQGKQAAYRALYAEMSDPPPIMYPGLIQIDPVAKREYERDPKAYASKIHHVRMDRAKDSMDNWNYLAKWIAGVFIAGEALAFAAIGYRLSNFWTFYGVATCLAALCVAAVLIPIFRFDKDYG
ncbi:hypothetical protein [Nonomuraea zeae]|uniref:Uncharacterized protein n=1 Tax=Nonomuraea zeae TaxID=1642303 RepID=A0A5S4FKV3_9ACTN|nr:hypothetical protein [Nonomuraea zeae]TMR21302.1 hypothetical protein ETD85_51085 [Nonomuraea zeae]